MKDNPLQSRQYALQGFLFGLLPLSVLSINAENHLLPGNLLIAAGIISAVLLFTGVGLIFKHRKWGSAFCSAGVLLNLFILYFELLKNPLLTLFCLLLAFVAFYYLLTARLLPASSIRANLQLERILGCSAAGFLLSLIPPLWPVDLKIFSLICAFDLLTLFILIWQYSKLEENLFPQKNRKVLLAAIGAGIGLCAWLTGSALILFFVAPIILFLALKYKHADLKYLELIVTHPARCLVLTFLGLCISGTLLLRTPWAMTGELELQEAAFSAVSAVCVTGLTVIDISEKLTVCGQFFLLILIQLGGLGIMTLTTLVLHFVGKLSLSGEQLITELTQGDEKQDVFDSLRLIVRVTFIVELIGALVLIFCFYNFHGNFSLAFRQGVFTSISAFCNAGFFPGPDNLLPYAGEKLLLIVVALEIIIGGIAPAVIWSFIKMRRFNKLPAVSRMVLGTTAILVFGGTFLLLLFEWNGIFNGMSWHDKLVNGFFQSVTLRTAGFNTVSFSALGAPAYLIMIVFMFIGGSPGGTAGGIKTTTIAVLYYTFRAAARNEEVVIACKRRIVWRNIIQAVATLMSAALVLMIVILMLVTTQTLKADRLIFEAVSALATVGLSLDCTAGLDPVGRTIIMAAMFIGRIGPLTLFCFFLSERKNNFQPGYPQTKIPLG